jgi:hypothetical protein
MVHCEECESNICPVGYVQVFDGVTIGFKTSMCHMIRPWEVPNNYEALKSAGAIKPAKLYDGSDLERYTMITEQKPRLVLWMLAQGKSVLQADYATLLLWLETNRPELVPYIKIGQVSTKNVAFSTITSNNIIWSVLVCNAATFESSQACQ